MNFGKSLITLVVAALGGAAALAAEPSNQTFVLSGSAVADRGIGDPTMPCWWENGTPDGLNALQSQTLSAFNARAADDFILESGRWHLVQSISVCMAVSVNVTTPNVALELYTDCNGKPGTLVTTLIEPTKVLSATQPYSGFNLYEFTFDWSAFEFGALDGCTRFWVSPYGIGTGAYFWATANNGQIQGAQGQFRASNLGYSDWTDVEGVVNFNRCSDFCFEVCAKSCYTVKDQGNYDLAGLSSIKFPNIEIFDARAADNFQITPYQDSVSICRIDAYLATNCDPTRVFAELLANNCSEPGALLYTLTAPEVIEQTGVTFDGLQVYLFRFDCPENVVLQGGNDYWFSLAALSGGTIFDRAIFLYKQVANTCTDVHITPGVYKNPFAGIDDYTPVSDPDLAGAPREFAFEIYASPIINAGPRPSAEGDSNGDGTINFQDIITVLQNWGVQAAN